MTAFPTSLVRFRDELEAAIEREQRLGTRGRRRAVGRVTVVAAAVAALAVGVLAALPGDPGGRLVEPASAAQRAAAALAVTPGSIVHVDTVVEQQSPDGSRTGWRAESWQRTAPPYDVRQIVTHESGERVETATVGGSHQRYDRESNSVHVGRGSATPQPATAQPFRDQVLDLLRSGKLTRSGDSTAGDRRTISFTWNDGHTRYEYVVDAGSFEPVRWRFTPRDASSETTVTFRTYEILSADRAPLDLTHHHPDATVHREPSS